MIPDLKGQKKLKITKLPSPRGKTGRAFQVFLDFYRDGSYNRVKIQA